MENKNIGLKLEGYASRRAHDFYATPPNVTAALMLYLQYAPITIWEPACGNGMMSKVLEAFGHTVISSDIRASTGYGEQSVDYLSAEPRECHAIITNPPFAEAERFIRKAVSEASVVAMLLKSQYWHASKRISLFDETKPSLVLPLSWRPDFDHGARGGAPVMECLWTVWIKDWTNECIYDVLPKPPTATMSRLSLLPLL